MQFEYSIYIEKVKTNILDYYFNISENNISKPLIKDYRKDMENNIKENNIYNSNYYILIKLTNKEKISEVLNNFNILKELGNKVEMIVGKKEIEKLLYNSINKVYEYE